MHKRTIQFQNILSRLLFFNIVLILIATLLPQIIVYNYFTNQYKANLEESNYKNIKQIRDFVDEAVFERLVKIPVTHFSDISRNNILIHPINHQITDQSFKILEISQKIYDIQSSYPFVNTINVYYSQNELLFRGAHVFFLDTYEEQYEGQPLWLKEIILSEERLVWRGVNEEKTAFVYARAIPYFGSAQENRAMLAIEVKQDALIDAVEKTRNSQAGFFGIISEQGEVIVGMQQEESELKPEEELLEKISMLSGDGFFKGKIENKEYIAAYAGSGYNEWKYLSLIPINDVFAGLVNIKVWLAALCAGFTCINVVFAIFITKKAHSPMEYIVNNIKSYVGLSGTPEKERNQYDLLEQTFHSLTFQLESLNEHLSANQPIIYHNMIKRILTCQDQHIYRDAEIIDFKKERFCCFIIQMYHSIEMNIHNKMLVNYSIIDLLNAKETWYDIYTITDENDLVYGIINLEESNYLPAIADDIYDSIRKSVSTAFSLCMGRIAGSEEEIHRSYEEAMEARKYLFFSEEKGRLFYNDLKLNGLKATGSAEKVLEKARIELKGRDWNTLHKTVEAIIEIVSGDFYTADYRLNTLADLVSTVRKSVIAAGFDEYSLFGGDIREQFKTITHIHEFQEWLEQILSIVRQAASNQKDDTTEDLKVKIEEYVEKNIFKDLTLSSLSEALSISPSHLSRIFKVIMGINCSEYLMQVKLDKAKELLLTTDDTVKEIAEKLGYASAAHFIRIFKAYFGITPKQMQRKGLNN